MQAFFGLITGTLYIIVAFLLFGIGWGMIGAPLMAALMQSLPKEASGVATGTLWMVQNVGAVFVLAAGIALFQFVVGAKFSEHVQPSAFIHGYMAAMLLLFVLAVGVSIFVFFMMKNQKTKDA